ncbi:hypothetical protein GHNINEIG_01629 [Hydrogenovibrio crunogenus]|uniref:Uncharacterized protein n=1 Tax=Hydrogenovibrio crunogenus TaxID=39765 RepID=A0A4P7P0W0_9GAMM|nr:hypothetical protein [Hydrogenovibrio crunogenus]QBZ83569.1 hypothetical protein GHNINEIG_01629 [Hydrogenovibrio crunogenus]
MWIHHIGEIMIAVLGLLILAHFGLHFYFKYVKRKKEKNKEGSKKESS